jgi:dTDP-4-dehydrorhamnose 3,5-epimerase/reductase
MLVKPGRLAGLLTVDLDVFSDERGNFREVFHAAKLADVPAFAAFQPVQQNVSHSVRGVIRAVHAEPWDKFIHVAYGSVFAALVDLRADSQTFGEHETFELDWSKALFVPRGFGNGFQALSDVAVYSYLVSEHWVPGTTYPAVAYDDPDLAIAWPIADPIVSQKDAGNPSFAAFRQTVGR